MEGEDLALKVGLKAGGWHDSGGGTLLLRDGRLFVRPAALVRVLAWTGDLPVPEGRVVVLVPWLRVPWYCISLQLGGGDAAIVPVWKRSKLLAMLGASGRAVTMRRTFIRLSTSA